MAFTQLDYQRAATIELWAVTDRRWRASWEYIGRVSDATFQDWRKTKRKGGSLARGRPQSKWRTP